MTDRANGHQDQASSTQSAGIAGESNPDDGQSKEANDLGSGGDRPKGSSSPHSSELQQTDKLRRGDNLAIGAPLTAAFIGGFLVIENLAGASQTEASDAAAMPEDMLGFDADTETWTEGLSGEGPSADATAPESDTTSISENPAAAPSEEVSLEVVAAGVAAANTVPTVQAMAEGAPVPQADEGDGGDANLNFININIGNGEDGADVEAIVEDEVISRNREVGTPGDDVLVGTAGHDAISGAEGDDVISGLSGSDILNGNGGDDQLFGGTGRDRLNGGAGDDLLEGGPDDDLDLLQGGLGDDVIVIESHNDVALERDFGAYADDQDLVIVREGYADDLPNGEQSSTFVFADNLGLTLPDGASGYRQLLSNGIEHVRLEGSADHDIFADDLDNQLTGNAGANVIHSGGGNDELNGGAGADRLDGGDGDDEVKGGGGDDIIAGGGGEDRLYGEAGDDTFVIGLNDSAIDTVFDHEGANRLILDGVTDQTVGASLLDDDLFVTVDGTPVAKVDSYVGNEEAFTGVDFGEGLKSFDNLLTDHEDIEGALDEAEAKRAESAADDLLSAHLHLSEPTIIGDPRSDQRLDGTEGDDWLSGFDGRDVLYGHAGNDILEGGDDSDKLRGGAGDDRYMFSSGEDGIDIIRDSEGRNLAELKGFDGAKVEGVMFGEDLRVLADGDLLFAVEDFAQNPESFQGVQVGQRMIHTEDLLA
ncbi:MAG: calcium-binding protein [Pseudomonadota bacterium]